MFKIRISVLSLMLSTFSLITFLNVAIADNECSDPITLFDGTQVKATFDGSNCLFRKVPANSTGSVKGNSYYINDRVNCPPIPGMNVYNDDQNCSLGPKPKNGFVWKDKYFYVKFDACSRGSNDGVNCLLGTAPDGVRAFEWGGGFYTTAVMKPECPEVPGVPLQFYDGNNCYLGAKPNSGFVWKDKYFYMKYDACSRGSNDGSNCLWGEAPAGTRAYENGYEWFFTGIKSCKEGRLTGDSCLIGTAPSNHDAFVWNNAFYYKSARCGDAGQSCCSANNSCDSKDKDGNSLMCLQGGCEKCGKEGQPCCDRNICDSSLVCAPLFARLVCQVPPCQGKPMQYFYFCANCNGYLTQYEGSYCSEEDGMKDVKSRVGNCSSSLSIKDGKCW